MGGRLWPGLKPAQGDDPPHGFGLISMMLSSETSMKSRNTMGLRVIHIWTGIPNLLLISYASLKKTYSNSE